MQACKFDIIKREERPVTSTSELQRAHYGEALSLWELQTKSLPSEHPNPNPGFLLALHLLNSTGNMEWIRTKKADIYFIHLHFFFVISGGISIKKEHP